MINMRIIQKGFYVIAFIIACILITSMLNLSILKKSVRKTVDLIKKDDIEFVGTTFYEINNKIVRDKTKVIGHVKGKGIAYYDDNGNITVVVEKNGRCAVKLGDSDKITIVKGKCPNYQLLSGGKVEIVTTGDGLYQVDDKYIYKGEKVNNYIEIEDKSYRIISFEKDGSIKVISSKPLSTKMWNSKNLTGSCETVSLGCNEYDGSDLYNYLNGELFSSLPLDFIGRKTWNIGGTADSKDLKDLINQEKQNNIETTVGLINISDYINSTLGKCDILDGKIICNKKSYLVSDNTVWLLNPYKNNTYQAWYLYSDGNMYIDATKSENSIRPVFYLTNIHIISGSGSSIDPFKVILK